MLTIVKAEDNIKDTETLLKNITEREEYQSNEGNHKRVLQQRKFKNFNYLKYMPNTITEETPQRTKHKTGFQKTYASVGTNNANAEKESQTLLKKLKTLNPNKRPQRRKNSPDGPTSKIRQEPSPRDEEIENQITKFLKQSRTNSIIGNNLKNVKMASTLGVQTTKNTELIMYLTLCNKQWKHYRHTINN